MPALRAFFGPLRRLPVEAKLVANPATATKSIEAPPRRTVRQAAADFWLGLLFRYAPRCPGLFRRAERPFCAGTFLFSRAVRSITRLNARRVLGPAAADADVDRVARDTVRNFYRFCVDVGAAANDTPEQLLARVESIEGTEHFAAARAAGKGVIVVTAHMGSFEVGLAALKQIEPTIHVVFRRDAQGAFEQSRMALRQRLGVHEAAVDDGWTVWMRLRDALQRNEAVVLQGDRVMPGQKGRPVPFLGGHLMLPTGPMKLAQATGAPIVPVFSVRTPGGALRVVVEPALRGESNTQGPGEDPVLAEWASVLQRYVREYPDQWLLLQPAVEEDKGAGGRGGKEQG
jgi:lauroyl/myristoyl acyltransferase